MHDSGCAKERTEAKVRPALELADIVRAHGEEYRRTHRLLPEQHRALDAILRCRTAELGGHMQRCLDCDHSEPMYNSCLNRHCPKCQALAQARWVAQRMDRILPVPYFHVVFTLPSELRAIARFNRQLVLDMLFSCAGETLLELGRDPERLGAQLGITAVLHTWSRDQQFHPHIHCIVTGGGLSLDGQHWVHSGKDHLFPVQVMGALYRGKLLAKLRQAYRAGKLQLPKPKRGPTDPEAFDRLLSKLYQIRWVVYCKRPFAGPEQVIRYLGRYTHRIGIANSRLLSMDDAGVTFRTKNGKVETVSPQRFLHRFVQHVLPPGYVKIRHFGLMSSRCAKTKLAVARQLLEAESASKQGGSSSSCTPSPAISELSWQELLMHLCGVDVTRCRACRGRNIVREPLPRSASPP